MGIVTTIIVALGINTLLNSDTEKVKTGVEKIINVFAWIGAISIYLFFGTVIIGFKKSLLLAVVAYIGLVIYNTNR